MRPDVRGRGVARWVGIVALLPALMSVLLGVRLGWTLVTDQHARADYASGNYAQAAAGFSANLRVPLLPTWRDRFNRADADFARERYPQAQRGFEEVLVRVPGSRECQVRVNLALTHEALGTQDPGQSREQWAAGREVLRAGDCTRAEDTGQRRDARAVDARLAERQQASGDAAQEPAESEQESEGRADPTRQRLDRLHERSEQAQRDAARLAQENRYPAQDYSGEQSW